jgi:hypothetical protein
LAHQRKKYHANLQLSRDRQYYTFIRTKYGVTLDDYKKMLAGQNGLCKLCGELPKSRLHIDHDHKTGEIRGLLCFRCNRVLGWAKDRKDIFEKAAQYLA